MSHQPSSSLTPVIIGIDWADRQHDVCIVDDKRTTFMTIAHEPEVIVEWLDQTRQSFPGRAILVAIEQGRGALMHALLDTEGVVIYSINPKQSANYRTALYPSGGKTDPKDAELLALFLVNHREKLRPWHAEDVETRKLGYLSELRRKIVEQRKSLGLKLEGILKLYFPHALSFGKTTSPLLLELLNRWPSLPELKRPHPNTLRQFFKEHGVKHEDRQTKLITAIRSATPLTTDKALIETHALYVQCLVKQIIELNRSVALFDEQLKQAVAKHPDEPIFRALPGAGDALTPRLIVAFGADRDRYDAAENVQCRSGIAPITSQSGKSRVVSKRVACPKFLKQTFHEFADQARRWSDWSRAFYNLKRSQGMKHNAAVRALAFKWLRIMFRLWKTRTIYSEQAYIQQLRLKQSPIIAFLPKT